MDTTLTIRISSELKMKVEEVAAERGESISAVIRKSLEAYIQDVVPSDDVLEEVCRKSREVYPQGTLVTILDIFDEEDSLR